VTKAQNTKIFEKWELEKKHGDDDGLMLLKDKKT
jgi:uncharacterized membrane protein YgcG